MDLWARPLTALSTVSRIRRFSSLRETSLPRIRVTAPPRSFFAPQLRSQTGEWARRIAGVKVTVFLNSHVVEGPERSQAPASDWGSGSLPVRIGFSHRVVVVRPSINPAWLALALLLRPGCISASATTVASFLFAAWKGVSGYPARSRPRHTPLISGRRSPPRRVLSFAHGHPT